MLHRARPTPALVAAASLLLFACGSDSSTAADGGAEASVDASRGLDGGGVDGAGSDAPAEAASCASASLYVAPTGSGTACSCAAPCALETGRDQARVLAGGATSDVVVLLEGGTYRLTETFALTAADSGMGGHAIVYRAAPGATPVLSGAISVSGFTAVTGSSTTWVASVPTGAQSRQLYVNGRRATRARGPATPSGYSPTSTGFSLGDASVATWPDRDQLEIVGFKQWKMFRCPVADVSASGVVVAQPCWSSSQLQAGYTFDTVQWIENALELLDEGGEFYLDEAASKLYYAPRAGEDLATADVELPVLEQLVTGTGAPTAPIHDITFDGVTFAYGTWLAPSTSDGYASLQASMTWRGSPSELEKPLANVAFHAAHDVTFESCQFLHLGGVGLAFEVGAQQNTVDSSRFEDISSSAVMVGDVHPSDYQVADPTLVVEDNSILGSYVTRAGAEYFDACGIFIGYTTHSTVANSELFDLPYTGISAGWGWGSTPQPSSSQSNDFHQNLISHHMRALFDGGAIYLNGAQPGTTLVGNVVSNQAAATGDLYLDNGTQGVSASNNVVFIDAKADTPLPDPERSYWVYVQVYPTIATNNSVTASFTNDPTMLTPMPIDPSNTVATPTDIATSVAPAASLLAAAGAPLRSPEIAAGKVATASSTYDASHVEAAANDGNAFDGWSPSPTDAQPWWQVDLGGQFAIDAVQVVSRWAIDQPVTRRSYRVVGSDDPTFATSTTLASVDATGIPHQAILAADVSPAVTARYVRVEKTVPEYFFLGEVRVHGAAAP